MLRHYGGWCSIDEGEAGIAHVKGTKPPRCCDNFPTLDDLDGLTNWVSLARARSTVVRLPAFRL